MQRFTIIIWINKVYENRVKYYYLVFFTIGFIWTGFGQSGINNFLKPSDTLNKQRRNAVVITQATLATVTLVGLDRLWYSDFERSKFRTINDNSEWLQMDKMGHVYAGYQLSRLGANSLNWAGVSKKDQLIYGAGLGYTFLTAVEIMDGFSSEWGFSWGDVAANTIGTGLYVGQELLWSEQRINLKYSFSRTSFASQNPDKLGQGLAEEFLKDYNGQTYWLSFNINSFLKTDFIPDWLSFSFGYGAEGMLTGTNNNSDFPNQNRYRQYYLSFDVDLTRIKTKSNFLKTLFNVLNTIKVPMPTLQFNRENAPKAYFFYF